MRKLIFLLLIPFIAFGLLGLAAAPATASHSVPGVQATGAHAVVPSAIDGGGDDGDAAKNEAAYSKSWYLPVNRWGGMAMHSRLNWWNPVLASNAAGARAAEGTLLGMGNGMWGTAGDWVNSATSFDPMHGVLGYQIDKIAGILGTAIKGAPTLVAALFAMLFAVALWRALKTPGTRPFGRLIQAVVVFGLIAALGVQAQASTADAMPAAGKYDPSPFTPVWIASAAAGTVDTMAGALVTPIMSGMRAITDTATGGAAQPGWSCSRFVESTFDTVDAFYPGSLGSRVVATSMNTMWLRTAYASYRSIQFGGSNPFAEKVACYQLERQTSAPAYSRAPLFSQALYGDPYTGDHTKDAGMVSWSQPLIQSTSDNEANDRVLMGLAACEPSDAKASSFTVRSGWDKKKDGSTWITADNCMQLWKASDVKAVNGGEVGGGPFDIGSIDDARGMTDDAGVLNYISTLQGSDPGVAMGGITVAFIYLFGALISACVFGILGLAVLGSKIFMLILIAGVFLVAILTLFLKQPVMETMRGPLQRFMGVTIFAFGASAVLALLATLSLIIATIGTMFGPEGTGGNLFWVSLSPLAAVIAIHFIFTKMLKVPSPVTPTGALAWGTAGGAIGGAVGAGLVNRGQNALRRGAANAGRHALGSSKATSWMVGNDFKHAGEKRKGAGDAGRRRGEDLGTNNSASMGSALAGGTGADEALMASRAANEAMSGMSAAERKALIREAKRDFRDGAPTAADKIHESLAAKAETRRQSRMDALSDVLGSGEEYQHLLSESARGRLRLTRSGMDDFLQAPGTALGSGPMDRAQWGDLSLAGKREALRAAAARRREERKPLAERAKENLAMVQLRAKQTRDRAAEGARNLAANTKSAALGTRDFAVNAAQGAAYAAKHPLETARMAPYAAQAGVDKARAAATAGREALTTKRGQAALVGAGIAVAALGNPVVGGVVVAGVARKQMQNVREHRAEAKQQRQAHIDRYLVAAAKKRSVPGTSTTSTAPAITTGRDDRK